MSDVLSSVPLTPVDGVVLALLLYGLISGLIRGLSGELARALAFLVLLAALYHLHPRATQWLEEVTRLEAEDTPLAALGLLVAAALTVYLLGRTLLKSLFKFHFRGLNERLGGAIAGTLRGGIMAALLLLAAGITRSESIRRAVTEDSWFGRRAHAVLPDAYGRISDRYGLPPFPSPSPPTPDPDPDSVEPPHAPFDTDAAWKGTTRTSENSANSWVWGPGSAPIPQGVLKKPLQNG